MYANKNRIALVRKSLRNSIVTMEAASAIDNQEAFPTNRVAVRFTELTPRFQNTIAATFASDKNKNKQIVKYTVDKEEGNRMLRNKRSQYRLNNANRNGLQSSLLDEKALKQLINDNDI